MHKRLCFNIHLYVWNGGPHDCAHTCLSPRDCAQTHLFPDMFMPGHNNIILCSHDPVFLRLCPYATQLIVPIRHCDHTRLCSLDCAQAGLSSHAIEQRHECARAQLLYS